MRRLTVGAGITVGASLLLACMGFAVPADLLINLAIGWAFFLHRVLPQVTVNRGAVVTAAACLVGLAVGVQLFCRWLFAHVHQPADGQRHGPGDWPVRWTAAILGVVVLMFVAGIAAAGIAHQVGWLLTSPEPVIDHSFIAIAARIESMNNLHQMAGAMHTYKDEHGTLPPAAICDQEGRPLLSWRVLLLPYVEQEDLYKEFRLDEPWDSPHNLRLLPRMPKIYLHPATKGQPRFYRTHYQVFVGKGAAFETRQGLRLPDDFPDGLGNTILIAEAAEAVPWTKPEDLVYDPDLPLPPLGGLSRYQFNVALADGSVRSVSTETSEQTLRAAVTRNGGDELGPEW